MSHYGVLPKHAEDIVELPNGIVWPWVDRDGRDDYKVYTENREIARELKRQEGVRIGAVGYPVQGCDFICRAYVMKHVLKLLGFSEPKTKVQSPLQNELF